MGRDLQYIGNSEFFHNFLLIKFSLYSYLFPTRVETFIHFNCFKRNFILPSAFQSNFQLSFWYAYHFVFNLTWHLVSLKHYTKTLLKQKLFAYPAAIRNFPRISLNSLAVWWIWWYLWLKTLGMNIFVLYRIWLIRT